MTFVFTLVELGLLRLLCLRFSLNMALKAQLRLYPVDPYRLLVAMAFITTALDLPKPHSAHGGMNPMRGMSPLNQYVFEFIRPSRPEMPNFLLRLLLLLAVPRLLVKVLSPIAGVPVCVILNALLCYKVGARSHQLVTTVASIIRCVGGMLGNRVLSFNTKVALFRTIGITVVATREFHFGSRLLLHVYQSMYPTVSQDAVLDVENVFMDEFALLIHDEQVLIFKMLALAIIIRGGMHAQLLPIVARALQLIEIGPDEDGARERRERLSKREIVRTASRIDWLSWTIVAPERAQEHLAALWVAPTSGGLWAHELDRCRMMRAGLRKFVLF
jgi:hypothetical protein